MNIWHISDTHGLHASLNIPKVDMVIHSGDAANYMDPYRNEAEMRYFLEWFAALSIRHKIFVAGNHDSSIERGLVKPEEYKIIYLENQECTIEGIKIWGSPITPTFGAWAFMKARHKIYKVWEAIPPGVDILITHTPPMGILDLSSFGGLNQAGCHALAHHIQSSPPRAHLFGHIHNNHELINSGTFYNGRTTFSNASCVTDGKLGELSSHGNIWNSIIK